MYDLIIKNGVVIDGTGSPGFHADVAVKDGKIARIGRGLTGAAKTLDAAGLVVTPGFIDSHSHADSSVLRFPDLTEKVEQGITVNIAGQCGSSATPLSRTEKREKYHDIEGLGNTFDLRSDPAKFFSALRDLPLGCGTVFLIGHGTLRKAVMGMENRAPTPAELEQMKSLLRTAMEHGARGLSFGLYYAPGSYAATDEAVEIAKVAGEFGGVIAAHVRNEGPTLAKSVREFLTIAEQAGTRAVVSHHKACDTSESWGKVSHTLRMIDEANSRGMDVYCDVYPYTATSTGLASVFLPTEELARGVDGVKERLADPEYRAQMRAWSVDRYGDEGCGWVFVTQCTALPEFGGRYISDVAAETGKDPFDVIYDILLASKDNYCPACFFTICEEDVETVMRHPRAMLCTDSGVTAKPGQLHHPRLRGAFPRALGRYVRERKVVTLPEMIRKMTSMPAQVYDLPTKGLVREGMDADLCVFDPDTIRDTCWFDDCWRRNEGLRWVLIAGEVVAEDAVYNGKRMAKALL
ncbi:MAG: D-aminoacylase [Oscillospiraceae bacterium]|nr:D-aminoacylase [Oscillospiraceae bacterium]